MSWPQYTILILCLVSFVIYSVKWIKDPKRSPAVVSLSILGVLAYYVLYALVLHEGGFW